MMVVITYDVNTSTAQGAARLRKVARLCERFGTRVQNSVFEVIVDAAQLAMLKAELASAMDMQHDTVRIYRLGNSYAHKIETVGKTPRTQPGEALIL